MRTLCKIFFFHWNLYALYCSLIELLKKSKDKDQRIRDVTEESHTAKIIVVRTPCIDELWFFKSDLYALYCSVKECGLQKGEDKEQRILDVTEESHSANIADPDFRLLEMEIISVREQYINTKLRSFFVVAHIWWQLKIDATVCSGENSLGIELDYL